MARPFILLSTQRSGSTWVQEMLNSHPELKVYSEMFLSEARGMPMWEPNDYEFAAGYLKSRVRRPQIVTKRYWTIRYLRGLFDQPGVRGAGFKYMYDQVAHSPDVLSYAAARRVRVVHLCRNLLDVVISAQLAQASGVYHVSVDDRRQIPWVQGKPSEQTIQVDPSAVLGELRRLARERRVVRAWLRLTKTPSYEVRYEPLVADPAAFRPVLRFLGVSDVTDALGSGLKKIRTSSREEVVSNFDEVEATLAGTEFESLCAGEVRPPGGSGASALGLPR